MTTVESVANRPIDIDDNEVLGTFTIWTWPTATGDQLLAILCHRPFFPNGRLTNKPFGTSQHNFLRIEIGIRYTGRIGHTPRQHNDDPNNF